MNGNSIFVNNGFEVKINFKFHFVNDCNRLGSIDFNLVFIRMINLSLLVSEPSDHGSSESIKLPFIFSININFDTSESDVHFVSVFGNDGDFELFDGGFFVFNRGIRCISVTINSYLDVEINFDLKFGNSVVTVILDDKDLLIIPISKSGDFQFHGDFKTGDSVGKISCSSIFGVLKFNDKFVLDLQFKTGDVFNSPSCHFILD